MKKVLIIQKIHEEGIKLLENKPNYTFEVIDSEEMIEKIDENLLIDKIKDCDAVSIRTEKLTGKVIDASKKLKIISRHGVGYDNVDLKATKKNSVTLSITANANAIAVSEHVLFMILYLAKGGTMYDDSVKTGNFGNRNKLPKNISIPKFPNINETNHTKKLKPIIEKIFKDHPGSTDNFWFATEYDDVIKLLNFFIKEKSNLFGDYEDAVNQKNNILFHSALSPYINLGLLTPEFVIQKVLEFHKKNKIRINSLEGYIRQVIGWREFMRGVYQSYSDEMESKNFFKQKRKMKKSWYEGTTGLPPLDHAIKNAKIYGWSHHIERLMILSNIMNLCEIKPIIVYKWFMEMFVDSSDWVMVPNVYGMGLFSDGGIFATKPYICGSSYFMKMMDFKKGDWCNIMDGLYWRFINRNRNFFLKNPRLSMMVRVFDKMKSDRKKLILSEADKFIKQNTI